MSDIHTTIAITTEGDITSACNFSKSDDFEVISYTLEFTRFGVGDPAAREGEKLLIVAGNKVDLNYKREIHMTREIFI